MKQCPHCGANEEQSQPHDSGCPRGGDPTGEQKRHLAATMRQLVEHEADCPDDEGEAAFGREE